MAQNPVNASAVVALTGSPQTIVLFTASTIGGQVTEVTDLTLEASAAGPFDVQLQVGGVTIDQYQVSNTAPIQIDSFGQKPTASNGQTIALVLPSGAANITYNVNGFQGS